MDIPIPEFTVELLKQLGAAVVPDVCPAEIVCDDDDDVGE